MPRHNRRSPAPPARPIRLLSERDRERMLRDFAREHLDEHAMCIWAAQRAGVDDVVMTGSECPLTGQRFLSTGRVLDPVALRLAKSSGAGGNLAP